MAGTAARRKVVMRILGDGLKSVIGSVIADCNGSKVVVG